MSRRRCCCSGASTTFCVSVCPSDIALVGAVVSVGGQSCTTGAGGCCRIAGLSSGTYTITVTYGGSTILSTSRTVTAGGSVNLNIAAPADFVCCGPYAIPHTLTLTDALGSITLTFFTASSPATWEGSRFVTLSSYPVIATGFGACHLGAATSGPVCLVYFLECHPSTTPHFTLKRTWQVLNDSVLPQAYGQYDATTNSGCTCGGSWACGGITDTCNFSLGANDPSSVAPWAASFAMTNNGANITVDPVGSGDTVAVSA